MSASVAKVGESDSDSPTFATLGNRNARAIAIAIAVAIAIAIAIAIASGGGSCEKPTRRQAVGGSRRREGCAAAEECQDCVRS